MSIGTYLGRAVIALAAFAALGGATATLADDKCEAQCDDAADKCNQAAGQDSSKSKQCDSTYEECLAKCK
jgi:hypothetical protein